MKKILIVEDDPKVQQIYGEALRASGYSILPALKAELGLKMVREEKPDMVLLDIMFPGGMNGFDLLEQMMRDETVNKIPVVVLTNLDSERKVAMDIGAKDYLVKANTSIEQLLAKVSQYA